MATQELEISDVKTNADVHKLLAQKCIFSGYNTTLGVLVLGIATLPLGLTRINFFTRVQKEYKVLVGALISMGASFASGIYVKNSCQKRILKELEELNLGHLTKGIEV